MTIPEVKRVCVIGAGTMGGRISLMSAIRGYETVVYDASKEAIERVPERHEENVARWIARGVMTREDFEKGLPRLSCTTDPEEAAHDADLVSEAVPEIVEVKRKVHAQFEGLCPPHTILSTSTSGLLVSDIEGALKRPDKFAAMHFNGSLGGLVVDIMRGTKTSDQTIDILVRFGRSVQEVPLVMRKEKGGYICNSLLGGLHRVAWELVVGGYATPEEVDKVHMIMTGAGAGPFGSMDFVGLNVIWDSMNNRKGEAPPFPVDKVIEYLRPYIEKGELGMKSGKGFYTYPNPAYRQPDFLKGD